MTFKELFFHIRKTKDTYNLPTPYLMPFRTNYTDSEWFKKLFPDLVTSFMVERLFLSKYGDLSENISRYYSITEDRLSEFDDEFFDMWSWESTYKMWINSIDNVMTHAYGLAKMNYTPYENYDKNSTITTTNSGSDTTTNVIGETNTESTFDDDTNTSTIGAHTDTEKTTPTTTTYDSLTEYNEGSDEVKREYAQQLHQTHRDGRTDSVITYEHTDTNTIAHGHKIEVIENTHGNIGVMDGATMGLKDYEYMMINDLREFFFKLYVRDFGGNSWG